MVVSGFELQTFYMASVGSNPCYFFFQAEDGIRDLVRSRGLGDVYKRQVPGTLQIDHRISNDLPGAMVGHLAAAVRRDDRNLSLIHI